MEIKDRINRLEVNQMHIIDMLEKVLNRLPEQRSEAIDNPKVPARDREIWGEYVQFCTEGIHRYYHWDQYQTA